MRIDTTYTMTEEVFTLLHDASLRTGKDVIDIATNCMRKMMRDYKLYLRKNGRIKYQERKDENTGLPIRKYRVKVSLLEREYSYFQDMRQVFRRSISLVMAIAVLTYLGEVVEMMMRPDYDENADNYPFMNYAIQEKCIKGITTFRIWWGVPDEIRLLKQK